MMIRLAASDLDGTLLDSAGRLPEEIFPLIEALYEKGIYFCAASGRQLVSLEKMFAPVRDKIVFIAENGAICAYRGEIFFCKTLGAEKTRTALAEIAGLKDRGVYPLLCTPDCAYYEDDVQPFVSYVEASYLNSAYRLFADVLKKSDVCKIAVFDAHGPENNSMKILPRKLGGLRVIQSGADWLDISSESVNKGVALGFVQKKFGILRSECAAFGDHMNDYEMLLACDHSYVTENAFDELKKLIGNTVPSNDEGGVLRALKKILSGSFRKKNKDDKSAAE